jgi:hypothetical protein
VQLPGADRLRQRRPLSRSRRSRSACSATTRWATARGSFRPATRLIDAAGTRDAQARVVPGFPASARRSTRWPRWHRPETRADPPTRLRANGKKRLAALDDAARRIELRNAGQRAMAPRWPIRWPPVGHLLARCRSVRSSRSLIAAAQVPDDYSTTLRALGLYPLTRHAFAAGIRLAARYAGRFRRARIADPASHRRVRYAAAAPDGRRCRRHGAGAATRPAASSRRPRWRRWSSAMRRGWRSKPPATTIDPERSSGSAMHDRLQLAIAVD